ncbi:ATP-binding protein [Mariprofundus sp. KV]|uniref:sensor histidine kinase n=1 Tax=Mariprofundus sp. KV TaxID=2608715 RepID=UPI001F50ED89|nr:ATP-binding protein [Mariprofundus sp. KV]
MAKGISSPSSSEEGRECRHEVHAEKMSSLGHFTQAIVHDIRNSLHIVVTASAMIKRRSDDPSIHNHLNAIDQTIERTNGLIERILTFANNSEDHLGIIDLSGSIDESISLTRPMIPPEITVDWQHPAKAMHILGDHGQLYQVVLNLLKNAIEAIGRGNCGSILVTLNKFYPWAELRVKDSGPGIAADVIDLICEPAFTTKADGNGFGLANVFDVVEKHGGTMEVASPAGEGAEFIILLPLMPELNI